MQKRPGWDGAFYVTVPNEQVHDHYRNYFDAPSEIVEGKVKAPLHFRQSLNHTNRPYTPSPQKIGREYWDTVSSSDVIRGKDWCGLMIRPQTTPGLLQRQVNENRAITRKVNPDARHAKGYGAGTLHTKMASPFPHMSGRTTLYRSSTFKEYLKGARRKTDFVMQCNKPR